MPTWNDNVVFSKVAHTLTENVDIVHYANADVMVVKSRDYVVARMKRIIDGNGYLVARSIELSELPETKGHVRGHIHIGAGRMAPHPTKQDTTVIDYIMCIDLKGLIPKSIVNSAMAKMMQKDYEQTKLHYQKRAN
uniref:START domain-containing protein n=1 Tax=Acrobeloides nanus TaxID=290746 RepID=A0A914CTC7_9BILA